MMVFFFFWGDGGEVMVIVSTDKEYGKVIV